MVEGRAPSWGRSRATLDSAYRSVNLAAFASPSEYSENGAGEDAHRGLVGRYGAALAGVFAGGSESVPETNVVARCSVYFLVAMDGISEC